MLTIEVKGIEGWDYEKEEFVPMTKDCVLHLEHSLLSLSKWESRWKKPFLSKEPHTQEEALDYVRCMTLDKNVDDSVYYRIPPEQMAEVNKYIDDPMTATTFKDQNGKPSREIITAELIYYWMISLQIPFECQKWHLSRLLTLIRVCSIKNAPDKKMDPKTLARQNSSLNAARRAKMPKHGRKR